MWWLLWGYGGSYRDVEARWGCGSSMGMWTVEAQSARVAPDCNVAVLGSIPAFLTDSLLRGGRSHGCVSKIKSQDVRRSFLSKKKIYQSLASVFFFFTPFEKETLEDSFHFSIPLKKETLDGIVGG
jgi:hypothetical protein